jgi:hypothetical protein
MPPLNSVPTTHPVHAESDARRGAGVVEDEEAELAGAGILEAGRDDL